MLHTCDVCGSADAPFGFMPPGVLSQWFCREHRDQMPEPGSVSVPKSRQDCIVLAQEILAEIQNINDHIDKAIALCEAQCANC